MEQQYSEIREIVLDYLLHEFTQEIVNDISSECGRFLKETKNINIDVEQIFKLYIECDQEGDKITIFGCNLLSALWASNIFPKHPQKLIDKNECIIDGIHYVYNPKSYKLKVKKRKK